MSTFCMGLSVNLGFLNLLGLFEYPGLPCLLGLSVNLGLTGILCWDLGTP